MEWTLWFWLGGAATFHISMDPSPVLVSLGSDVLLQCIFPAVGKDTPTPTVFWHHGQWRLAEYDGILVTQRPGTELPESAEGLRKGNASLLLHRVAMADLGSYYCTVTVGEQQAEAGVLLEISAAPHISLFPVQVSLGEKITLLCQIKGFYPARGLQAWWLRNGQRLPEAISMGSPTQNPDGTFDLELILNLTLESHDLEANFTCHVTHPALEHPLQQILDMEVKEGLEEEEQEQGEVRTATDEEDREQPQETSDFQSPGRNWEVEKLLPRDHTESEGEILQGDRKTGFLQGYRKTVGLMEVRYSRIKRQIIVECRETEDKILALEGTREGQILVEKGESKGQNLEGYVESEGRVLEEFEVDTELQFQEAKEIKSEGQIIKGNREIEVHKRDKEATEKQNGEGHTEKRDAERQTQRGRDNGLTQGGDREGLPQGGDREGLTQGGEREGLTQGGESEGLTQGGESEGLTQRGDSEGQIQGGDSEGLTQGGDSEGLTQRGDSEGLPHGGDREGLTQGGESEGLTQGGDREGLTQGGDSEGLTQGGDSEGLTQGGDSERLTQGGEREGLTQGGDREGLTQGGDSEGLTQGGDSEGLTQGGEREGLTQGGDSEGQIQGGDSEGLPQGGDREGLTQGGESEGLTQGGDSEGLTQRRDSEGLTQRRDSEGLTQGEDSEGQIQGGNSKEEISRRDAKVQVHLGDEEAIKGLGFKEVGRNETRRIAGEGEAMEQIPSGYEGIEGWISSGKIDNQSLRIDEDLSEQSPGAIGDRVLPKDEDIIQLQG
ncbi:uncharacterized protein LOC141565028 isoform X2 [Sminthopsis crassicaudata]|uniref:uncharacterized protein LOC141565028 isoform X2 n=1 Tax=Sminthopsis crassicaudata TaxID=9301 RepID=UPI003D699AB7